MTEAQQRRFYFPNWNGCAVANDWMMSRGRLRADLDAQRTEYSTWPDPAGPLFLKVATTAEQFALQEHRAVNADDLRHACNWVATTEVQSPESRVGGRGKVSSGDMTNAETNRAVTLFKLLTDPDDLDAVMDWLHPERQEKQSFIAYLERRMDEAAIIAICRNAFDTSTWKDLPIDNLRWICKQGKHRKSRRQFWRQRLEMVEAGAGVREPDPY